MRQELPRFDLLSGRVDQLTKLLPLLVGDRRLEVLDFNHPLADECHDSDISNSADARLGAQSRSASEERTSRQEVDNGAQRHWLRRSEAGALATTRPQSLPELLLRYKSLEREIERKLNQLDRLQRMRLGQPCRRR